VPVVRFSSDSWVFATPFLTFPCCQAGLQGRPESSGPYNRGRSYGPAFCAFISPSECASSRAGSAFRRCRLTAAPPLMGFASPPRRHLSARVHSRQTRESDFGIRPPRPSACSALVVSHHLDGFLRERAMSLLHLIASLRFAAFPPPGDPNRCRNSDSGRIRGIPRNAFHTPRRIPLVCSRTVSPRPLPS
jgi:hypothetical protein